MNILSYVDFEKLCHVIEYFPQLNKNIGGKTLIPLSRQVQEPLNGKKNNEFGSSVSKINTRTYHNLKMVLKKSVETLFLKE